MRYYGYDCFHPFPSYNEMFLVDDYTFVVYSRVVDSPSWFVSRHILVDQTWWQFGNQWNTIGTGRVGDWESHVSHANVTCRHDRRRHIILVYATSQMNGVEAQHVCRLNCPQLDSHVCLTTYTTPPWLAASFSKSHSFSFSSFLLVTWLIFLVCVCVSASSSSYQILLNRSHYKTIRRI